MSDDCFTLKSFAKINLYLEVVGKRTDGFHDLCTVFQTVSLFDEITFKESPALSLACDTDGIPVDEGNLILKAALVLQRKFAPTRGAEIDLIKRIPSPGGLGGGSSNAATTLIGLKRLWQIDISDDGLQEIAASLGSDVPFFLVGGTASGHGRGVEISSLNDFPAKYMLIVTPNVNVSTSDAFAGINAPHLTKDSSKRILHHCRSDDENTVFDRSLFRNDFEVSVFAAHPEVSRVKTALLALGASDALLCGSGASVFGLFDTQETRQTAIKALDFEVTWRKFAVASISRKEFRESLEI